MDRDVEMMHGPPISYSNNNADDNLLPGHQ